jgi:hypothetical protein
MDSEGWECDSPEISFGPGGNPSLLNWANGFCPKIEAPSIGTRLSLLIDEPEFHSTVSVQSLTHCRWFFQWIVSTIANGHHGFYNLATP